MKAFVLINKTSSFKIFKMKLSLSGVWNSEARPSVVPARGDVKQQPMTLVVKAKNANRKSVAAKVPL